MPDQGLPSVDGMRAGGAHAATLDAAALDAADPLAPFRDRFVVADPGLVYLDGNSLGRAPKTALAAIERVARDEWAGELVRAWDHWLDLPLRVGDELAPVIGAAPGTVAVTDSTTVNLYRLASAALDDRPGRRTIVASRGDFPTDRYILEGLAAARGLAIRWLEPDRVEGLAAGDVARAIDGDTALVLLSLVDYRSAALVDLDAVEAAARDAGAHTLWDLSHAAGVIDVDLARRGARLAVGCTYKYLCGGPGAPAFLYVSPELQERLRPPVRGWFAQRDQFAMGPAFDAADGIAGWLVGTPPVLSLTGAQAGIRVVAEAGVTAVRAKAVALTAYAIALLDAELAPLGCSLGTPRDPTRRGGHVAIRHPRAGELTRALVARGVVPDFREPDVIRFGLSPLTTSFGDVRAGVTALRELLTAL